MNRGVNINSTTQDEAPDMPMQTQRGGYSVTTGHVGPLPVQSQYWDGGNQVYSNRLGNKRAPIPTCSFTAPQKQISFAQEQYQTIAEAGQGDTEREPTPAADDVKVVLGSRTTKPHLGNEWVAGTESDSGSDLMESDTERPPPRTQRPMSGRKGTQKKVGRPIAFTGDPNSPHLTEAERRRIKRRVANRESARRVRSKRLEERGDLQAQLEEVHNHNQQLQARAQMAEAQKAKLFEQMEVLDQSFKSRTAENIALHNEIHGLRHKDKMAKLNNELDRCAQDEACTMPPPAQASAFSNFEAWPASSSQDMNMQRLDGQSQGFGRGALQDFPSLNLDPMPSRAASLDRLNIMLNGVQ